MAGVAFGIGDFLLQIMSLGRGPDIHINGPD
jgi:hypothetical protein